MRTTIVLMGMLLFDCGADSHALLAAPDAGADEDAGSMTQPPPEAWDDCIEAIETTGRMGDACVFVVGCQTEAPPTTGAFCHRGELLQATMTVVEPAEGACGSELATVQGAQVEWSAEEGGCLALRTCVDGVAEEALEMCQDGARTALRPDAPAPYTDCEDAATSGRDGDACTGRFLCERTPEGHGVVAWCDHGMLRLAPEHAFYEL